MPTNPTTQQRPSSMAVAVHGFKPTFWNRRCRLRSFPHPDPTFLDLDSSPNFHRSISTPCFPTTVDDPQDQVTRVEIISGRSPVTHALVVEAAIAMAFGARPIPVSGGLSAAYCLRNRTGESFAVVKPVDEEPLAVSILGRPGSRLSVRAGETGIREVAAYLLDHGGFSGVPPTALIKISLPDTRIAARTTSPGPLPRRVASIQRFVPHDFDAGELGPSRFSVASVHRIGILDVRLLNIDRHAGNILVKKQTANSYSGCYCGEASTELVPIDHGLCLPELLDDPYFEWLHWPQAAVPFSELESEYIAALDPFKDAEVLREELPVMRESAIRILVLCTVFLKRAAEAGLCLADIGDMMTREWSGVEEGPSMLETLCKNVEELNNNIQLSSSSDEDEEKHSISSTGEGEFQFEMDCDKAENEIDGEEYSENVMPTVLDIPLLFSSKPPVRTVSERALVPVNEEDEDEEEHGGGGGGGGGGGEAEAAAEAEAKMAGGMIMKSVSFSEANLNCEAGGGSGSSRCISFRGLSEEEWRVFLERFDQLLPEAFEARKGLGLKQQRLGTSCKF